MSSSTHLATALTTGSRERSANTAVTASANASAANSGVLSLEVRAVFLLSPSTTLVTLTLAKLAVIGAKEDNLDFTQIKGRQHSVTFLKNLKNNLTSIPDDCREGLKELDLLLGKEIDWNQNIIPNWGIGLN